MRQKNTSAPGYDKQNAAAEKQLTDTQQHVSAQNAPRSGSVFTRITALTLILLLLAAAYYLFITKQEQKRPQRPSPTQTELIITLPQE